MEKVIHGLHAVAEFLKYSEQFKNIPGFLFPAEGYALLLLARHGPGQGEVVEIGSFMGLSTCWLATGLASAGRGKVTAIDTFQGSPEHQADPHLKKVLAEGKLFDAFSVVLEQQGLAGQVQPLVGNSHDLAATWNRPIRLLFIDGDHSYEGVRRDFVDWERFVAPGGVVCFHDVGGWDGVTKFYTEKMQKHPGYREAVGVNSLRSFIKLG